MSALVEAPSFRPAIPVRVERDAAGVDTLTAAQLVRLRHLLEARWREQLADLTELSMELHDVPGMDRRAQRRLSLEVAGAHQRLRGLEEGLARLASGRFGHCEACARPIPYEHLEADPAGPHCAHCRGERDDEPGSGGGLDSAPLQGLWRSW